MNNISIKAPGKLILAGEYAVLYGKSAIVAAIDRYAKATFSSPGRDLRFSIIEANGTKEVNLEHPLIKAVTDSAQKSGLHIKPGSYIIDTSTFYNLDSLQKLGLGSSAAASVALSSLFYFLHHHHIDPTKIFAIALAAHKQFSHGLGSGIDVAASSFGHNLSFKIGSNMRPDIKKVNIGYLRPHSVFIDTKTPQNTRNFLQAFEQAYKHNPHLFDELFNESEQITKLLLKPCNLAKAIKLVDDLAKILTKLGQMSAVDIMSNAHQEIACLAKKYDGTAKPSGAGGGDFAWALIEKNKQEEFCKEIAKAGYASVPLNMAL